MSTSYFMPTSDSGKADLLDHLASNLTRYKDLLVLSDETCASVSADAGKADKKAREAAEKEAAAIARARTEADPGEGARAATPGAGGPRSSGL